MPFPRLGPHVRRAICPTFAMARRVASRARPAQSAASADQHRGAFAVRAGYEAEHVERERCFDVIDYDISGINPLILATISDRSKRPSTVPSCACRASSDSGTFALYARPL